MFTNKSFKRFCVSLLAVALVFSFVLYKEQPLEKIGNVVQEFVGYEDSSSIPNEFEPTESQSVVLPSFDPTVIPEYDGNPWIYVNNNQPFFTKDEITTEDFERYSDLDDLGRCGVAFACLSPNTQPNGEERESLSHVRPSGWKYDGQNNNVKYDCIDGAYLYNRCHLIMWALSAENDNALNLITGTRYLNIDGMLPWETKADEYVDETGNHLMYRVTPVYTSDNLVADGVLMEAYSVEDNGAGLSFCVYAYNVQPGIEINYKTGESRYNGIFLDADATSVIFEENSDGKFVANENVETYILNVNSKKIHTEDCEFGKATSDKNKKEYTGTIQELIDKGYTRCSACRPE